MLLTHLTESFPKKSKCKTLPSILICSGLKVMAPTVSASPGSFSSPTLRFSAKISQHTVAILLLSSSSASKFFTMCSSISGISLPNCSALLNFSRSFLCLRKAESENQTYLIFPESLSCHLAMYIFSGSQTISFQLPGGFGLSAERFRIMSSSLGPSFHFPRLGCFPLPAKRHEGSAVQLAISISFPSTMA